MPNVIKDQKEKLLKLVKSAIAQDEALREQYKIGDKFRFIRDRLKNLLERVEEGLNSIVNVDDVRIDTVGEDEVVIYVYLFNAQGIVFQTWKKMVNASVFYEYSVNRPIYTDKSHVEANIRTKANKAQHAYLTVVVKKDQVFNSDVKDVNGNPVVKVKEGSLLIDRMHTFTHNGHDYVLSAEGEIVKKPV